MVDAGAIPVRNAWYLLIYAWDMARWRGRWDGAAEAAPNLVGLLARVLVDSTTELLRHQLPRAYTRTTQEIQAVRGRIDFARSLKRLSFESGRAVCAYSELSSDTLRNRILRSTLDHLMRDPRIVLGGKPEHGEALRHDLRKAVRAMDGVAITAVQSSDFGKLQLGRNDIAYLLPLSICHLIYRYEMPSEAAGADVLAGLLRDEIAFADLFERFIRNFCRYHYPEANVAAEELSWFDESGSAFVPRMRTDITMEWREPAARRFVIDTKYYTNTLAVRFEGSEKFHSANLYQLYTYLRTQEHLSESHRAAAGLLLYPATRYALDEKMRVQGHKLHVATVDLAQPWPVVENELLARIDRGRLH